MAKPRRRWTDDVIRHKSFPELFEERTGLCGRDDRVRRAASPRHRQMLREGWKETRPGFFEHDGASPAAPAPRGPGRPEDEDFNACVVAMTDLVDELQEKRTGAKLRRHDFIAVTIALIYPGDWPLTRINSRGREVPAATALEDMRSRVKEAYHRVKARSRNKTTSKRNKTTSRHR